VLPKHPYFFFLSEESETVNEAPGQTEMHLGVMDSLNATHIEIQRRRKYFISVMMYLTEKKPVLFSVEPCFSPAHGKRLNRDFNWFASYVLRLSRGTAQSVAEIE